MKIFFANKEFFIFIKILINCHSELVSESLIKQKGLCHPELVSGSLILQILYMTNMF